MTDHDWGIDMTDEEADAFCAAIADMRPRHVEPLGWVLVKIRDGLIVDRWNFDYKETAFAKRDYLARTAHADVLAIEPPEYVVCALVPDGAYSCGVPGCCGER